MMRVGFLAYSWDLLDEGPEAAIEQMAGRCGCDSLLLNAIYHHARLLRPRVEGPKLLDVPEAAAGFVPDPARYPGALSPRADRRVVEGRVLARAREASARRGMDFGLWIVGLHNSTLGRSYPPATMVNCFGDRYEYALCPSSEAAQLYLRGLVADAVGQFAPDRIVLEAVGHLGMRHGLHHEMFFVSWSQSLELLLSLCFCDSCASRGAQHGVDVEALRLKVRTWAEHLLREERGSLSDEFRAGEAASLLAQVPGLAQYLAVRAETIAELVAELSKTARAEGVQLEVIPASFHRPTSQAWLEGVSLDRLSASCGGLLVPAYWRSPAEVTADLEWAASLAQGAALSAGLNACDPGLSGPASLTELTRACQAAGCGAVYYYNYGLLTERRLDWVAAANRAARKD
jgi:hypothetical protein